MHAAESLKSRKQIDQARDDLRQRGLLRRWSRLWNVIESSRFFGKVSVGDPLKSWDLLKTIVYLEEYLPLSAPILDIGAYASAVLPALQKMGFRNLTGIDLNPGITKMPFPESIRYEMGNFLSTPFEAGSFSAITAVSVIEHGFRCVPLLTEVSRLLAPGGYFLASVDYWPEKIDTEGISAFGMDWTIFSQTELLGFFGEAKKFGLHLPGPVNLEAKERVIRWGGMDYTFAWLVLKKES